MSAIIASTVGVKTMADNTLRLTIDIDPQYANDAFILFGTRGSSCAIARLTNEAAVEEMRKPDHIRDATKMMEKPKCGALARLAGQLCQQESFQNWIGVTSAEHAAESIRSICGIESRSELDHNEIAAALFHNQIRIPYSELMKKRTS